MFTKNPFIWKFFNDDIPLGGDTPFGESVDAAPEADVVDTQTEETLNPAWNSLLEGVPDVLIPKMTPVLRDWDKNYQRDVTAVKEQVQSFAPYKEFLDNKVDPQELTAGLTIVQQIRQDPKGFLTRLQEAIGQGPEDEQQQEEVPPGLEEFDLASHPEVKGLKGEVERMKLEREQEKYEAETQRLTNEFATTMESLKQQYGDALDPQMVATFAHGRMNATKGELDLAGAAEILMGFGQKFTTPQPPPGQSAPRILPTTGGFPQGNVDRSKMSNKEYATYLATQQGQI